MVAAAVEKNSEQVTFGEELRVIRDEGLNWPQHKLAREVNKQNVVSITEDNLKDWENNRKLEAVTPEILNALALALHAGLKQVGFKADFDSFKQGLTRLLKETRQQITGGADDIDFAESFAGVVASYRKQAKLERSGLSSAVAPAEEFTGKDVADIERGRKPPEAFMAALVKVPEVKPYLRQLDESFKAQDKKSWKGRRKADSSVASINGQPSEPVEVPQNIVNLITQVNAAKRALAKNFLKGYEADRAITKEEKRSILVKLGEAKNEVPGLHFTAVHHLLNEVDSATFAGLNPSKSFANQHEDILRTMRAITPISERKLERIKLEIDPAKDGGLKQLAEDTGMYNMAVTEAREALIKWRKELSKKAQSTVSVAAG